MIEDSISEAERGLEELLLVKEIVESRDHKTIIDWNGFCGRYYWEWENAVAVYLEAKGWTKVGFRNGESDSFGPLTRACSGFDSTGKFRRMIYS